MAILLLIKQRIITFVAPLNFFGGVLNTCKLTETDFRLRYIVNLDDCCSVKSIPEPLGNKTYVTLYCKYNGDYTLRADDIKNRGCKYCRAIVKKSAYDKKWKEDCSKIHNNQFDYSITDVGDVLSVSKIKCKQCDLIFDQTPASHKYGRGCPVCSRKRASESKRKTIEDVEKRAKKLGFRYDFSKSTYITCKDDIEIICDKGHVFFQSPDELLNAKHGCQKCTQGKQRSEGEKTLFEFLSKYFECEHSNRKILSGLEIDIFIPSIKVGIEYNGLFWHSDNKNKVTHLDKQTLSASKGVHLIHIYEDDWLYKRNLVENKLLDSLQVKGRDYVDFSYTDSCVQKETSLDVKGIFVENSLDAEMKFDGAFSMYYQDQLMALAYYITKKDGRTLITQIVRPKNSPPSSYYREFVRYFSNTEETFEIVSSIDWIDDLYLLNNRNTLRGVLKPSKQFIVNNRVTNKTVKPNAPTITKSGYAIYNM